MELTNKQTDGLIDILLLLRIEYVNFAPFLKHETRTSKKMKNFAKYSQIVTNLQFKTRHQAEVFLKVLANCYSYFGYIRSHTDRQIDILLLLSKDIHS